MSRAVTDFERIKGFLEPRQDKDYLAGSSDPRFRDFSGLNLSGADLSCLNLKGVDFRSANLRGANLSGSNCESANFLGAILTDADLTDARLYGALVMEVQTNNGAALLEALGVDQSDGNPW